MKLSLSIAWLVLQYSHFLFILFKSNHSELVKFGTSRGYFFKSLIEDVFIKIRPLIRSIRQSADLSIFFEYYHLRTFIASHVFPAIIFSFSDFSPDSNIKLIDTMKAGQI